MILVPLSGGIDSTAVLWKYRDRPIVSFHISLGWPARERVAPAELVASRRVIEYVRASGAQVEHEEFKHALDDPLRLVSQRFAVAAYTGLMLRQCPEISTVAGAAIAPDMVRPGIRERAPRVRRVIAALAGRDDFETWLPFIECSKREVIETLPPDLLRLTFSCFDPIQRDGEWTPCGGCAKCEEVRG